MGYYYTTSAENAVPGKSWAMPKTHVPASPVKERGHRFYMPEVGRWASRDPLGEVGGNNICSAFVNSPINERDAVGLELTHSQCTKGIDVFYKNNPSWKAKVDYWDQQPGKNRCSLNLSCGCCSQKGDTQRTMSLPYRTYTVQICENNQTSSGIYETVAHELTHFFAGCADMEDKFDCMKEDGQAFFDCSCAKFLCKEIQAFRKSGACKTSDECWAILKELKYLDAVPCTATPPYAKPTREGVFKHMGQCKAVDIPDPHYPRPVPDL